MNQPFNPNANANQTSGPDDGQRFGTREAPRVVTGTIGGGGRGRSGGFSAARISRSPNARGVAPAVPEGYGTRETPRVISGSAAKGPNRTAKGEAIRVVNKSDARTLFRSYNHLNTGAAAPTPADQSISRSVDQLGRDHAPSAPGVDGYGTARHEIVDELEMYLPLDGERVVVLKLGPANCLRTFFRSSQPINPRMKASIAGSISAALSRPKGHAAECGENSVAVIFRAEDVPAVYRGLTRRRPSPEVRERILAAFDRAFGGGNAARRVSTLRAQPSAVSHQLSAPDRAPSAPSDQLIGLTADQLEKEIENEGGTPTAPNGSDIDGLSASELAEMVQTAFPAASAPPSAPESPSERSERNPLASAASATPRDALGVAQDSPDDVRPVENDDNTSQEKKQ